MLASKTFAYDGLAIRVSCSDPSDLQWLEEFLLPSFSLADDGAEDCSVTLEIDDQRHRNLTSSGAQADGGRVRAFVLDRGPVAMDLWPSSGSERVFFDAEVLVFYFVDQEAARVRILATSRYRSRRVALMRVVRELVMSAAWTPTRVVLHAAACASGETGIIIAGPKGAGKTTLLMYALGVKDTRFIANDRVVVDLGLEQATAHGMPTVVSVRAQTFSCLPAFAERWAATGYDVRAALDETAERPSRTRTDVTNLTPAQFCDLLDVSACAAAPVHFVLFPRLAGDIEGLRVQELSPAAAAERLAASIFAATSLQISQAFALPGRSSPPDPATVHALSRTLISRVRSFDCALGSPAAGIADEVGDFLDTLKRAS